MDLRIITRSTVLILLFSSLQVPVASQTQSRPAPQRGEGRVLIAIRTTEDVSIDGILSETTWQRRGTSGFIQREPIEGSDATEDTEVWIAYDDYALYVAARMYDSNPDSIIARLARRDENPGADHIGVFLDAAFDRRTGHYFIVNPSGAIRDGTFSNDTFLDRSWDGVWESAVNIDAEGWTAEFRIPYSQLRFHKQEVYTWGIDFYRRVERKNEESFLILHPRNDQLRVSRWALLQGIEGIEPPARVEILPYFTGTGKFIEQASVGTFNAGRDDPFVFGRDYQANIGADAKIGLSGNMTLDVSLNPDFAQVEVDPAVVNLTAYEVRYEEKRPFFIEGSDILRFGRGGAAFLNDFDWVDPSFFYSRRIGRAPQGFVTHKGFEDIPDRTTILGAAKVSGKIDNTWSITALSAVTAREYGEVDSAGTRFREEIEPLTLYGVVRTRKEFNDARQAIGVIGTFVGRDVDDGTLGSLMNQRAFSGGVDGWLFLDEEKDWVATGWAGVSYIEGTQERLISLQRSPQHYFQRPDADHVSIDSAGTSMSGWASRFWIDKVKGNFIFNAALGMIHPKFEANDVGFMNFADFINAHVYTGYQWFESTGLFRYKYITATWFQNYNFGGVKTRNTYVLGVGGRFANYWGGDLSLGYNPETFDDQTTRGGPLMRSQKSYYFIASAYSDEREELSGSFSYTHASATIGSNRNILSLSLLWKISSTVNLSVSPSLFTFHQMVQYVTSRTDPSAQSTLGGRYIFATIDQTQVSASFRLNWTMTPKLSLQMYMQPLIASGEYTEFKELTRPGTITFTRYGDGASTILLQNDMYTVDPDGAGLAPSFTFSNPNFNYKSLRLNAVLRWEFQPGSTLYLVWTNEKEHLNDDGDFRFGRDFRTLLRDRPDNVIALKLTYWWSR